MKRKSERIAEASVAICLVLGMIAMCTLMIVGAVAAVYWLVTWMGGMPG